MRNYYTMMVKTHLSLSHDPDLKGVPEGWRLPVRDILVFYRRKVPLSCNRGDQPHARHRFRSLLQKDRREYGDRKGYRIILKRYVSLC